MPGTLIDPVAYHRDVLPERLAGPWGRLVTEASPQLQALGVRIGDDAWTYRVTPDGPAVAPGVADDVATVVAFPPEGWSDLVGLRRSVPILLVHGDVTAEHGQLDDLIAWEPALRALYAGLPIYDPTRVALVDRHGAPLDLRRTFAYDDPDDDLADFLHAAGYLHLRGVFSAEEIARLQADADHLAATTAPGDPHRWFADDPDGQSVLCRVTYAHEGAPAVAALAGDARLERLARLLADDLRLAVDRMDGMTLLYKPAGRLRGLANLPWHQDCGVGGHHILCPSVSVGVQLTGSSGATGALEVIAGSHGQSCSYVLSDEQLATYPRVVIPTEPGDVTVHVGDLIHASPPPGGAGGRRTLYFTWFPTGLWDHVGPGEAMNDMIIDHRTEADRLARPS